MRISPDIAVVAAIDPMSDLATVTAAVLRFEIAERLDRVTVVFGAIGEHPSAPRYLDWKPVDDIDLDRAALVILDDEVDPASLVGVSPERVIPTGLLGGGLTARLRRHVDADTIAMRTNMLDHLGLLELRSDERRSLRLSAADLLAVARAQAESTVQSEPELGELFDSAEPPGLDDEIARLVSAIGEALPHLDDADTARLRARITVLEGELEASDLERQRLELECNRLNGTVEAVTERLATLTAQLDMATGVDPTSG